jgi:transcriptional regulator with GAF, ATPase, and Fis domain
MIGRTPIMDRLFELLRTVAATTSTVLVTGETGTGKELAARAIHDASPRSSQRFVALNCSAIPETLLEAELFGHVRGAFTGAVANRQGRLEQANRGTMFLDEVGTMSPALQSKLLRVLQSREFERVGDSQTIRVDVRIIAATNSDLKKLVQENLFREDLYYRLNVIPVRVPPLRERRADIPLALHFLDRLVKETPQRARVALSQDAQQTLMAYGWPGNVRQLENVIERAFALSPGRAQLSIADLPDEIREFQQPAQSTEVTFPDEGVEMERLVADFEHSLIQRSRAVRRQQAPGRRPAPPQTDDAHREASASRTALTMARSHAFWVILAGAVRRRSARRSARTCCRRCTSCSASNRTSRCNGSIAASCGSRRKPLAPRCQAAAVPGSQEGLAAGRHAQGSSGAVQLCATRNARGSRSASAARPSSPV